MFACGDNCRGQLGLGNKWAPRKFTTVPSLPYGKVAKQVVAGGYYTMILAEDGTVFACGKNEGGQLGLGDTGDRWTFTAVPTLPVFFFKFRTSLARRNMHPWGLQIRHRTRFFQGHLYSSALFPMPPLHIS